MTGYDDLGEVYEWLISDAKLAPADFAATFDDVLAALPVGAHVLDASCGTGQLAIGLAGRGLRVTASDASATMVRRTTALAVEHRVPVVTMQAAWEELPRHLDDGSADLVFCVGNSLHHAPGAERRSAALAAMARVLRPGGRLVLTSRTWERVRARGSRLEVAERLVTRHGRDAVVVYRWEIAETWEEEHRIEIAIAQLDAGRRADRHVRTVSEVLSCWPYRREQLDAELREVGLRPESDTWDPDSENYRVVAVKT